MRKNKKFAVVLAGCGVFDGAEIHEATLTLLAIKMQGADYQVFAPDIDQYHVVNHTNGEEMKEKRNVLIEAARIARGDVFPLTQFKASEYDGIIFPGGFGVAKNLCTFAFDGPKCKVLPEVEKCIKEMAKKGKPIGALCISPVLIARVLGNITVTIGSDPGTVKALEKMGATHVSATQGEIAVDQVNKIVSTPCYMLEADILEVAEGAENVVKEMLRMM